jgi:hypothetical protein
MEVLKECSIPSSNYFRQAYQNSTINLEDLAIEDEVVE